MSSEISQINTVIFSDNLLVNIDVQEDAYLICTDIIKWIRFNNNVLKRIKGNQLLTIINETPEI